MRVEDGEEQLFFTTVRIEVETLSGPGTGTGFIFVYRPSSVPPEDRVYHFLVSNKHVVKGAKSGRFWFLLSDENGGPKVGYRHEVKIDRFEEMWLMHPDPEIDITIMPLDSLLNDLVKNNIRIFYRAIPNELVLNADQLNDLNAIEQVTFIGYPNGMFDKANFTPVARRGTTATPPVLDYAGLPTFLVDASVFPGSSGSPVFVSGPAMRLRDGQWQFAHRMKFLGVIASVFTASQRGQVDIIPIPTRVEYAVTTWQMIDLGVVFKSSTVLQLVEHWLEANRSL